MKTFALITQIEEMITPFLNEEDVELVDLKASRLGRTIHIQILVDKVLGGVTLEECSKLNRRIGDVIERENLITQHYVLEVSSPGLDRPLRTQKDFLRVLGREVRLFLSEPVEERLEYKGFVREVNEQEVMVDAGSLAIRIPLDKINKATQVI